MIVAAEPAGARDAVIVVVTVAWCVAAHRPALAGVERLKARMSGRTMGRAGQRRPTRPIPATHRRERVVFVSPRQRPRPYDWNRRSPR